MKEEFKICPVCENWFIPKNGNQKFCSNECFEKNKTDKARLDYILKKYGYTKPDKICPICGSSFEPKGKRKYCSPECSKIAKKESNRKFREKHPERVKEIRNKSHQKHRLECNERERERYWRNKQGVKLPEIFPKKSQKSQKELMWECRKKHGMCFECPTEDGECLFD